MHFSNADNCDAFDKKRDDRIMRLKSEIKRFTYIYIYIYIYIYLYLYIKYTALLYKCLKSNSIQPQ